MPVHQVSGGYRWGTHGKTYKQKWKAARQGRAIEASVHQQNYLKIRKQKA